MKSFLKYTGKLFLALLVFIAMIILMTYACVYGMIILYHILPEEQYPSAVSWIINMSFVITWLVCFLSIMRSIDKYFDLHIRDPFIKMMEEERQKREQ